MAFGRRGVFMHAGSPRDSGGFRVLLSSLAAFDVFFSSVVLLLDWAGADGGTDTTDLSDSAHVDTFEGNAQIDTAIQSPEATNSALFDGADDSVVFPDSVDWDFGTADFTVECSVRFASLAGTQTIFGHSGGGADGGMILRFVNPNIVWVIGATTIATRALAPAINTYHHIAISRIGTDLRIFFDGIQSGATITDSTAIGPTARDLDLGSLVGTVQELNGLIGAVRITKGVGRYGSNFTPPTTMYPTGGPTDPDFASVVLLLDFAGADGGTNITDLSDSAHVETFVGNAQIDTDAQFLIENSLLSDGTGDRITYPDSDDWNFGTGDFTIEFGVNLDITDVNYGILSTFEEGTGDWYVQISDIGAGRLRLNHGPGILFDEAWVPNADQWYHVAITRQGTNLRAFIDGVQLGATVTNSTNLTGGSSGLFVADLSLGFPQSLDGNLGAVRITKGVARYTANFTPPTVFYPKS